MYLLLVVGLATAAAFDLSTLGPGLNHDKWWGPDCSRRDDTRITRTKIHWPTEVIEDLVYRLKDRLPYTPTLEGTNYNYGLNTATLDYWIDYWANEYNFTQREAYMNQYPHYKTQIQGLYIHFIHIKPKVPRGKYRIPILMMHGWPGSVREFYEAIKYLTKSVPHRNFVPELIIPSLPGFGCSDATNRPGLGAADMASIFKTLMYRLGHEKFFVQGGDWGAFVAFVLATLFPNNVLGHHSNLGVALTDSAFSYIAAGAADPVSIMPKNLINRLYPLTNSLQFMMQESGYYHIQAAKPDAIGVCVSESPVSLIAWFLQFFAFSAGPTKRDDPMGGTDVFTRDEFLDNAMMYWATGKITTAIRIYAETFNFRNYGIGYVYLPTPVPTVISQTATEIFYFPPNALKTKFTNLVAVDPLDKYGHFFALEAPEVFSEMVLSGFQRIIEFRETHNITLYDNDSCLREY